MTKPKGFALIELMIVVAIIGIVAAVAIPKFADLVTSSKIKDMGYESKVVMKYFKELYPEYKIQRKKIRLFLDEEKGGSIRAEYERFKAFGKKKSPFRSVGPKPQPSPSSGVITMQRSDLIPGKNCDCTCR